ncbi:MULTISPECIES: hypothetical protein [unclassified Kitasatospora]|uniref:hypothetical protein n=1 Tax=unclassified Kitasatospora TaxID=2633591 RepID=UPI00070B9FF4|nr:MULTISPECIES: hypothetical protein [unclassified Kitasatospora]KQV18606.1 hypothetical protein ASC99_05130 [Kitasatospora sp. Root107]KRB74588.1 hypothetical protein ASE03_19065 [Kitasatospora sp. Root187]
MSRLLRLRLRLQRAGRGRRTVDWLLLYATPESWRFSACLLPEGGIACGWVEAAAPDDPVETAGLALRRQLRDFIPPGATVTWSPGDKPGWWHGTVRPEADGTADGGSVE